MNTAHDFTLRLQELLRRERVALGEFLVALSDFDRRRLWLDVGYASLFDYLRRELGLSKASAFYRMRAAQLLQRFPAFAGPLRDGRLCLTSVAELAKVVTPENLDEVLPRFFQLSKQEAKAVAAELRPDTAPPLRDVVTTVRVPVDAPRLAPAAAAPAADVPPADPVSLRVVRPDEPAAPPFVRPPPPAPTHPREPDQQTVEPLTKELSRLHFTVSREFLKKLDAARDALSHSHPNAGIEEILEDGLDLLLERDAKRKGLVKKPRAVPPLSSDPDHVPAHVRRAVWERDGGRCQFRLASGEICGSTHQLEIDHITPRALGGPSTVDNCRVACRPHNGVAAREAFGDAWMDRYTRNPRSDPPRSREAPA